MSPSPRESPLVSIYVPTRNRARLLDRALRSITRQDYPSLEVVVVDDASEDDTPTLLRTRASEDPRIRSVRHERTLGAPAARNRAVAEARGVFVTGLDDDDEFLPDRVSSLVAAHDDRYAFVCGRDVVQTSRGRVIQNPSSGVIPLRRLLHFNHVGNQALVLRERLQAVGGFDEAMPAMQDYDLWVRLVARYGPCLKLPTISYVTHVEHEGRISESSERRVRAHARFVEKHAALFEPAHRASMELLRRKVSGEPLGLIDYARLVRRENALSATLQLVSAGPPWIVALKNRVASMVSRYGARDTSDV